MIQIVKETLDVQIDDPVGTPAPLPGRRHRVQGRLAGTIPVRVVMETRLDYRLQMRLDDHLRHPISDRGYPQRPQATRGLRNLDETHRRREVTPRGHPIPDLVEVIRQVCLERLDGLTVHPGSALVGLDLLVSLPDHLFGNRVRLGLSHRLLLLRVDRRPRRLAVRTTL